MLERTQSQLHTGAQDGSGTGGGGSNRAFPEDDGHTEDSLIGFRRSLAVAMLGTHADGTEPSDLPGSPAGDPVEDGRRIGRGLANRVEAIGSLIGKPDSPRGPEWAHQLATADRLVRMLDGVSIEQLDRNSGLDDALSSLRLQDYLVEQARRTRRDLWHDEGDQDVPYDRRVAGAYLDDAGAIDQSLHELRHKEIDTIRADLNRGDAIRLTGPQVLVVTSEDARCPDLPGQSR